MKNLKQTSDDVKNLEEIIVVLSPLQYRVSKIPVIGRLYLSAYEVSLRNKLSDYKFIFK